MIANRAITFIQMTLADDRLPAAGVSASKHWLRTKEPVAAKIAQSQGSMARQAPASLLLLAGVLLAAWTTTSAAEHTAEGR